MHHRPLTAFQTHAKQQQSQTYLSTLPVFSLRDTPTRFNLLDHLHAIYIPRSSEMRYNEHIKSSNEKCQEKTRKEGTMVVLVLVLVAEADSGNTFRKKQL